MDLGEQLTLIEKMKAENESLASDAQTLSKLKITNEEEIQVLKEQIEDKNTQISKKNEQIEILENEKANLEKKYDQKTKDIQSLEKEVDQFEKDYET